MNFFTNCVNWPRRDVDRDGGLVSMIDGNKEITRRTFLSRVSVADMDQLEAALGYYPGDRSSGLRMSKDWAVSYHRSKLHGKTVYYFRHSAIEYVFCEAATANECQKGD